MRFTSLLLSGLAVFSPLSALAAPAQSKTDLVAREAIPAPAPVIATPIDKKGSILDVVLELQSVVVSLPSYPFLPCSPFSPSVTINLAPCSSLNHE